MKVRERPKADNAQRRLVGMPMLHLDGPSCQKKKKGNNDDDEKKSAPASKETSREDKDEPRERRLVICFNYLESGDKESQKGVGY